MEAIHPVVIAEHIFLLVSKWSKKTENGENLSFILKQTMEDDCLGLANNIVSDIDNSYSIKYRELKNWEEQLEHREDSLDTTEYIVESREENARWDKIYQMERLLKSKEEALRVREEAIRIKESNPE